MSLQKVNERWNSLVAPSDKLYSWDPRSTYIKSPPFFDGLVNTPSDDLHALIYIRHRIGTSTIHIIIKTFKCPFKYKQHYVNHKNSGKVALFYVRYINVI